MQKVLKPCSYDPRNTSTHKWHFMGKDLSLHLELTNHFAWRHEVCLFNHFSCTKFNHLRWPNFHVTLMNMKFYILTRSRKFKKIHGRWQNTKHQSKYQIQEVVKCQLFLILLAFYQQIHKSKPIINTFA